MSGSLYAEYPINKKNVGKREEYKYLLNGLIYCGECGNEYRGKKRLKGNDNAYKCKGRISLNAACSESRGISITKLETFIIQHLFLGKDLVKFLNELPTNTEETTGLKDKLKKYEGQLSKVNGKISRAYQLLLDEDLQDDHVIKEELKTAKKNKEDLEENIDLIQKMILEGENGFGKKRLKRLIGEYSLTSDFDTTKKLIHSLVEKITIVHKKEKKGGFFLVEIKYNGYNEAALFSTNWQAMKWLWLNRFRDNAVNEKDLLEDTETLQGLYDYYGIEEKIEPDFKGLETFQSEHQIIELSKEELVDFE